MNTHFFHRSVPALTGVLLLGLALEAGAAGTAFTYQGRLRENGAPVSGTFDFQFMLYDAAADGTQLGTTLALEDVSVANGLFSVLLDFGANVFTGEGRWLEIALRKGAETGAYATLNPRRPITATPYAVQAGTVANVPAASITGTVPDSRLSANVALLNGSPTFGGTVTATAFQGNGAGLTGIPGGLRWLEVTGTSQQAEPNAGYMVNNSQQVMVTLPGAPAKGDVVRVAGVGAGGWKITKNVIQSGWNWVASLTVQPWYAVASSADGKKVVVVATGGRIYTSTDSGISWIERETDRQWRNVTSSADGSKLVAVVAHGQIYTSTDSGVTWTPRESSRYWGSVASSDDGTKLVAAEFGGQIYTSTDSGQTWAPHESNRWWHSVASSADGTRLVAVIGSFGGLGQIYTSADSGQNWTPHETDRQWRGVASSADGSKLAAVAWGDRIFTSKDSGVTWLPSGSAGSWQSVASSADGATLVAVDFGGQIHISLDFGASWTASESVRNWIGTASSADGQRLYAVVYGGQVYTAGAPPLFSGGADAAIEVQYVGSSTWRILSQQGTVTAF